MILYPAIDLKDGQAVRLIRGELAAATAFGEPAARARAFADAGAEWLHVVDLDGAFAGEPRNAAAVEAILAAVAIPVQLGGGIRDAATAGRWLAMGVARVILGTAAVEDPGLVGDLAARHPGRIAVGIDAREGRVATRGWAVGTEATAEGLARAVAEAGVAAIIHTDIARDGAMAGPNVAATAALARAVAVPVIASGGVSSVADLVALRDAGGIAGAVVGRALYDGAVDLGAALAALRGP